jgi:hypothetical protein
VNIGAIINNIILDKPGIIVSLKINLKASANGCNIPNIPTTLGPLLLWIPAKIFLSNNVNKATDNIIGKTIGNNLTKTKLTFRKTTNNIHIIYIKNKINKFII